MVLGFLLRQGDDLPNAYPPLIWLEFRVSEGAAEELPVRVMPGDTELGGIRWCPLSSVKEGLTRSSVICRYHEIFNPKMKSKAENVMEAEIGGLVMVI